MISATRLNRFSSIRGFTLVELVLVIFICAMLAVLVFPAVRRNWGDLAKSTSASDLVRLLRHTRLKSANDNVTYRLCLEGEGKKLLPVVYRILSDGTAEKVQEDWAIPAGEIEAIFVSALSGNIQVSPEIEFDNGRVAADAWIIVAEDETAKAVVSVSSPSGIVVISSPGEKTNIQQLTEALPAQSKGDQNLAAAYWSNNCGKVFD